MDRVNLRASLVIGIIGVILVSVIYFRPVSIVRNYNGYIFSDNSDFEKTTEIKLVGELKKKLSLNYVFTGSIEVEGIKEQVILRKVWSKNNIFKSVGYNAFIETKNSKTGQFEVTGTIDTSKDFNEILIRLGKVDSKYNGKFDICGPSSTREEAKGIVKNIEKNN